MKIRDRRFAITGANRGIGWGMAEVAARSGSHLYLIARTWDESVKSKLLQLGAASVLLIKADLSTREGVESLGQKLNEYEIDILFNNAGQLTGGLIEEQNLDEIYSMFQVNLNALIHLTRMVIPGMLARKSGLIINNASVSAFMHFPCASTYAASKAAVVAFTDCIDVELKGTGVSTLCLVTPGIKTRMFDAIEDKYSKNFEVPKDSISPIEYAEKIKAAIEAEQSYLMPDGATSVGLWLARYMNPVFRNVIKSKFKRA